MRRINRTWIWKQISYLILSILVEITNSPKLRWRGPATSFTIFFLNTQSGVLFQQDNACPHTAAVSRTLKPWSHRYYATASCITRPIPDENVYGMLMDMLSKLPTALPLNLEKHQVKIFKLHGRDYHETQLGTSTTPCRDVWHAKLHIITHYFCMYVVLITFICLSNSTAIWHFIQGATIFAPIWNYECTHTKLQQTLWPKDLCFRPTYAKLRLHNVFICNDIHKVRTLRKEP